MTSSLERDHVGESGGGVSAGHQPLRGVQHSVGGQEEADPGQGHRAGRQPRDGGPQHRQVSEDGELENVRENN